MTSGRTPADLESLLPALESMPAKIDDLLEYSSAEAIADKYSGSEAYFFIGRGLGFPVALEGP